MMCFVACGEKTETDKIKVAVLQNYCDYEDFKNNHNKNHHAEDSKKNVQYEYFDDLDSMLLALNNGKVDAIETVKCTAEYIKNRNDNVDYADSKGLEFCNYSMMTMQENSEVFNILNNAITEIKADGTLNRLIKESLQPYITSEPQAAKLPEFEGAQTIKIAVTGDLPPMDYISAAGQPQGFNVALLSEIAKKANVNIEMIEVDSGARASVLESGRADAIFWTTSLYCIEHRLSSEEKIPGAVPTESYFSDEIVQLTLKSQE